MLDIDHDELESLLLANEIRLDQLKDECILNRGGKGCVNCKYWIDRFCQHPKKTWMMTSKFHYCERWEHKDEEENKRD